MRSIGSFVKIQLLLLLLTLAGVELVLQMSAASSLSIRRLLAPPWQVDEAGVPDAQMTVRGNPLLPDVDSAGYRNPTRPLTVDVVALGDSHTWGPEDFRQSWLRVFGESTGRTVYNMALPGYGPLHYLLQLDEALSLKPKLIIVAPYFGNDFYDCFVLSQRHPELVKDMPQTLVKSASERERDGPIQSEVYKFFHLGETQQPPRNSPFRQWLSDYSRTYGLLRALRYRLHAPEVDPLLSRHLDWAAAALTPEQRRYASVVDGPEWKTILTAPYRNRGMDDSDPRIRLGFELARDAVQKIALRSRKARVDILVALIPTKESVFYPHVTMPSSHPQLEELVTNEARLKAEWVADLESHGIPYVDALIPLRQALRQPYPEDVDGHPNTEGHRLIGAAIAARIRAIDKATSHALVTDPPRKESSSSIR